MKIQLTHNSQSFIANLDNPIDISLAIGNSKLANVKCYFAPTPHLSPMKGDGWEGKVSSGFPVNFYNISLNPHGNGTHTECYGHIHSEMYSVSEQLTHFHFVCQLISLSPTKETNGDMVFHKKVLESVSFAPNIQAIVIRSLPNVIDKKHLDYSGTNPPYFSEEFIEHLRNLNIKHLLVDLPSLDKESDGGKLLCHNAFWKEGTKVRMDATVTELIFVDNSILDGLYLLNLQLAPIHMDASISRPVLFKLHKV